MGLFSFGPPVQKIVERTLSPTHFVLFLVGAGIAGNLTFLIFDPKSGGGLGMSGITLALLTVYGRVFPKATLRAFIGPFPIQLSAEQAVLGSALMSLAGMLLPKFRASIAHSAHLGGMLFGLGFHKACLCKKRKSRRQIHARENTACWNSLKSKRLMYIVYIREATLPW